MERAKKLLQEIAPDWKERSFFNKTDLKQEIICKSGKRQKKWAFCLLEKNHPTITSDGKEILGSLLGMDEVVWESGDIDKENKDKDEVESDDESSESAKAYH